MIRFFKKEFITKVIFLLAFLAFDAWSGDTDDELITAADKGNLSVVNTILENQKISSKELNAAFPLSLKYAASSVSQRIALIGNAAQTLHPVAGQGFNLGLRDAYELAHEIVHTKDVSQELGTSTMLSRYRQRRQKDSNAVRIFTDTLVKLFSNDNRILNQACGFGLSTLDCLPPLKRFVARRMIFGAKR